MNSLKVKSQGKVLKALHHNRSGPLEKLRPSSLLLIHKKPLHREVRVCVCGDKDSTESL